MLTQERLKSIKSSLKKKNERFPIVFSALSDPSRFCIFKLLMEKHEICVGDVAKIFNVTASAASQQLKMLELSGLVIRQRMGQTICYEIKDGDPLVKSLIKVLS